MLEENGVVFWIWVNPFYHRKNGSRGRKQREDCKTWWINFGIQKRAWNLSFHLKFHAVSCILKLIHHVLQSSRSTIAVYGEAQCVISRYYSLVGTSVRNDEFRGVGVSYRYTEQEMRCVANQYSWKKIELLKDCWRMEFISACWKIWDFFRFASKLNFFKLP